MLTRAALVALLFLVVSPQTSEAALASPGHKVFAANHHVVAVDEDDAREKSEEDYAEEFHRHVKRHANGQLEESEPSRPSKRKRGRVTWTQMWTYVFWTSIISWVMATTLWSLEIADNNEKGRITCMDGNPFIPTNWFPRSWGIYRATCPVGGCIYSEYFVDTIGTCPGDNLRGGAHCKVNHECESNSCVMPYNMSAMGTRLSYAKKILKAEWGKCSFKSESKHAGDWCIHDKDCELYFVNTRCVKKEPEERSLAWWKKAMMRDELKNEMGICTKLLKLGQPCEHDTECHSHYCRECQKDTTSNFPGSCNTGKMCSERHNHLEERAWEALINLIGDKGDNPDMDKNCQPRPRTKDGGLPFKECTVIDDKNECGSKSGCEWIASEELGYESRDSFILSPMMATRHWNFGFHEGGAEVDHSQYNTVGIYRWHAEHDRHTPSRHTFEGKQNIVRVVLPQKARAKADAALNILTPIGSVWNFDHIFFSVDDFNRLLLTEYPHTEPVTRVELLTPPRYKAMIFSAIAIYMGYTDDDIVRKKPSWWIYEAGSAGGSFEQVYPPRPFGEEMLTYKKQNPTSTSHPLDHWRVRCDWSDQHPNPDRVPEESVNEPLMYDPDQDPDVSEDFYAGLKPEDLTGEKNHDKIDLPQGVFCMVTSYSNRYSKTRVLEDQVRDLSTKVRIRKYPENSKEGNTPGYIRRETRSELIEGYSGEGLKQLIGAIGRIETIQQQMQPEPCPYESEDDLLELVATKEWIRYPHHQVNNSRVDPIIADLCWSHTLENLEKRCKYWDEYQEDNAFLKLWRQGIYVMIEYLFRSLFAREWTDTKIGIDRCKQCDGIPTCTMTKGPGDSCSCAYNETAGRELLPQLRAGEWGCHLTAKKYNSTEPESDQMYIRTAVCPKMGLNYSYYPIPVWDQVIERMTHETGVRTDHVYLNKGHCASHYREIFGGNLDNQDLRSGFLKECARECSEQPGCKIFSYGLGYGCRYSVCGENADGAGDCPPDGQCIQADDGAEDERVYRLAITETITRH